VALSNMQAWAEAMDTAEIYSSYYVSPENLNDLSVQNTIPAYDSILDQGGVFVLTPTTGQFSASRRNLVTTGMWQGPYVTYQQNQTQTTSTTVAIPYDVGSLLDPWGNPFYLFSPLGLVRGDTGQTTLELYGDGFDRYTFVSLGPDGVKSEDDLAYQFGAGITSFSISSLSGPAVQMTSAAGQSPAKWSADAGTTISIRGINFGPSGAAGNQVLFNSQPLPDIISWGPRSVVVSIPSDISGDGSIVVKSGSAVSNSLALKINPPVTAVKDWILFQ
jgi:hypothetical protein